MNTDDTDREVFGFWLLALGLTPQVSARLQILGVESQHREL